MNKKRHKKKRYKKTVWSLMMLTNNGHPSLPGTLVCLFSISVQIFRGFRPLGVCLLESESVAVW